jgi:hypothetical protein
MEAKSLDEALEVQKTLNKWPLKIVAHYFPYPSREKLVHSLEEFIPACKYLLMASPTTEVTIETSGKEKVLGLEPEDREYVDVTINVPSYISKYLKMWQDSGIPAPLNELQSMAGWLRYLGENGVEKTKETMQKRMLILMEVAGGIHDAGPYVEELAEIYKNRPDQKPNPDTRDGDKET